MVWPKTFYSTSAAPAVIGVAAPKLHCATTQCRQQCVSIRMIFRLCCSAYVWNEPPPISDLLRSTLSVQSQAPSQSDSRRAVRRGTSQELCKRFRNPVAVCPLVRGARSRITALRSVPPAFPSLEFDDRWGNASRLPWVSGVHVSTNPPGPDCPSKGFPRCRPVSAPPRVQLRFPRKIGVYACHSKTS